MAGERLQQPEDEYFRESNENFHYFDELDSRTAMRAALWNEDKQIFEFPGSAEMSTWYEK